MSQLQDLLRELEPIVREAGRMAIEAQPGISRKIKSDGSIVTPADQDVERYLRDALPRLLPDVGIYGEEMGSSPEGENGLWCLDPIDGTSNYAFGSPNWGVSVGLVKGDTAIVGAVFLPGLGEMYLGSLSGGSTLNGVPIPPIPPGKIRPEELVSYPDRILRMYPGERLPGKMRHTGAVVLDAVYTACQRYRGLLGVREKLYDVAAALCITKELGADIRYADGTPLDIEKLKDPKSRFEKGWVIFPADSEFFLD